MNSLCICNTCKLDFVEAEGVVEARSIHLFCAHQQPAGVSIPNTHSLAQSSIIRIIFLLLPNLWERLSILKFEIVIFRKAVYIFRWDTSLKAFCRNLPSESFPRNNILRNRLNGFL
jgi:hypothetical protein